MRIGQVSRSNLYEAQASHQVSNLQRSIRAVRYWDHMLPAIILKSSSPGATKPLLYDTSQPEWVANMGQVPLSPLSTWLF